MTIQEFSMKCKTIPLPSNPMARVKVLARELADGVNHNLWQSRIPVKTDHRSSIEPTDIGIKLYLFLRWDDLYPNWFTLISTKYMSWDSIEYQVVDLTEKAFDLLQNPSGVSIFISYKRSESSAFALLMEDRLSQAGLSPFLDKQLQAGTDWQTELEQKIANSDYFILILGDKTLESDVTIREIDWALQYKKTIIPIWHNGFEYKQGAWGNISVDVDKILANTHTIRVIEENPLTYDTALRELLNRFGISG